MSSDRKDFQDLEKLDSKLKALQADKINKRPEVDAIKSGNMAWRMVLELVVGMILGFCVGFSLDKFFNTNPIFILTMTLLGFAGGIRAMMRTAQEMNSNDTN